MDNDIHITLYYFLINLIHKSVDFTEDYLSEICFSKDTEKFDKDTEKFETDLNEIGKKFNSLDFKEKHLIIGFFILLNYIIITFDFWKTNRTSYLKSFFMLKLRTDICEFYECHKNLFIKIFDANILEKINIDLKKILEIKIIIEKDLFEWSYPYKKSFNIFIEIRALKKLLLVCNDNFFELNTEIKDIYENIFDNPLEQDGFKDLDKILSISNIEQLEFYINEFINTLEKSLVEV